VFGRAGWARFTDDEGSLGDGTTAGIGAIVPLADRVGVQIAYDRQSHRRELESVPPGAASSPAFTGTEQLLTVKALFFFRHDKAVRPYAGIGAGLLQSKRESRFPTFVLPPGSFFPVPGPVEVLRYRTRGAGLGFAAGFDARVTARLALLADLTFDSSSAEALGSTRLTAGAGWRF
jgi:hypothetical protein